MEETSIEQDLANVVVQTATDSGAVVENPSEDFDSLGVLIKYLGSNAGQSALSVWGQKVGVSERCMAAARDVLYTLSNGPIKNPSVFRVLGYAFGKIAYQVRPAEMAESFAWCCVAAIKVVRAESRKPDRAHLRKVLAEIAGALGAIEVNPKSRQYATIRRIARHYETTLAGADEKLPQIYEEARQAFMKDPTDAGHIRDFGWVLHDCLWRAIQLQNAKLVRFFIKDYGALELPDEDGTTPSRGRERVSLKEARERDLVAASDVLSGIGRVKAYIQDKQWSNAKAACEQYRIDHPDSPDGLLQMAYVHQGLGEFVEALDAYQEYLGRVNLDEENCTQYVWFVVKLLGGIRPRDREWRKLKVSSIRVKLFLTKILNRFDILKPLTLPSAAYSALLSSVTRVCRGLIRGRNSALAKTYVDFLERWGVSHFGDDDRKDWKDSHGVRHLSLQKRITDLLIHLSSSIGTEEYLATHPIIKEYVLHTIDEFGSQIETIQVSLPGFLLRVGEATLARKYAREFVLRDTTNSVAWRCLGETYDEESEERLLCYCKAYSVTQGDVIRLFEKQRMEKFLAEREVSVEDLPSFCSEKAGAADRLINEGAKAVRGVVLSSLKGRYDAVRNYRVWWTSQDSTPSGQDYVKLENVGWTGTGPTDGEPISVMLQDVGTSVKPIAISPRSAPLWDGYPQTPALVCDIDASRGFVRIVTVEGSDYWADVHVCPELKKIKCGESCSVGILKRQKDSKILFGFPIADANLVSEFIKDFNGPLKHENGSPGGRVNDVSIPRHLIRGVRLGTLIHGKAVSILDRRTKQRQWLAVSVCLTT